MRTIQFSDPSGHQRLAVVAESGTQALDVSHLLDPNDAGSGLIGAIGMARHVGQPLDGMLVDLARQSDRRLDIDWAAFVVHDRGATLPISPPVSPPEVWAAGVSYRRSREAREYESGVDGRAFYTHVYDAPRPELFLKDAAGRRTVGPGSAINVRPDSSWSVPEPELALILDRDGRVVAYTIGNDVSARDIEAENPLYLPQAKVFARSCALGPAALVATGGRAPTFDIALRIFDSAGALLFGGNTSTSEMKRSFDELVSFLTRYNPIGDGSVLLTGTGIVPPDDFTLIEGHEVEIEVIGIGVLRNPVRYAEVRAGSVPGGT